MPRLFERGVRGTQVGKGGCLGLAIVRRLCELYGWQVSVAPRPQGGATATLDFHLTRWRASHVPTRTAPCGLPQQWIGLSRPAVVAARVRGCGHAFWAAPEGWPATDRGHERISRGRRNANRRSDAASRGKGDTPFAMGIRSSCARVARRFRSISCHRLPGWLLPVCLIAIAPALAQPSQATSGEASAQYLVDHWTTAHGLPVNGINRVLVSRSGYVWLATFDGLVRFDGHRFTVFRSGPAHPNLPDNRILDLIETAQGELWMLTEGQQLSHFDGRAFHAGEDTAGLAATQFENITADEFGAIWVSWPEGLAMRRMDGSFAPIAGSEALGTIHEVRVVAPGAGWVSAEHGLALIANEQVLRVLDRSDGVPLPVLSSVVDTRGRLWAAGSTQVVRGNPGGPLQLVVGGAKFWRLGAAGDEVFIHGEQDEYTIDVNDVIHHRVRDPSFQGIDRETLVRRDGEGNLWRNRLDRLDYNGTPVFEPPCKINDFSFGADGAIWVATACDGVFELRPRNVFSLAHLDGVQLSSVYSLGQTADGALWISTLNQGIARLAPDGAVSWLRSEHGGFGMGQHVIEIGPQEETWVGSCRVFAHVQCATPEDWPLAVGRGTEIQSIHRSRDGTLWVGGRGLWQQDPSGRWHSMAESSGLASGPIRDRIRAIIEVEDGSLWFATRGRGVLRRSTDGRFRLFTTEDGLFSASIRAMRLDDRQQLWIATEDRGLCRMRNPGAPLPDIQCIDRKQGLWSDSLHQLLFDDAGRMWINSNDGIFAIGIEALDAVIDGRTDRVYPQVYTERDGSPNREGNGGIDNAGIRLADGRMAFPTQGGVALLDPRDLPPPRVEVRAVFESLILPDGRSMVASPEMQLSRRTRNFTLQYTGLAPQLTAPAYFRYRLLPDQGWTDVGGARQISLSNLAPGSRTIELVALGSAGAAGSVAQITVGLPYHVHETPAFRLGVPMLLLLGGVAWVLYLRHQGRMRQRLLERSVAERTVELQGALVTVNEQRDQIERLAQSKARFFANVSHELRTPLALLTGPIDDYVDGRPPSGQLLAAMQRNAHRLERLIGQLLDLERIDARRFPLRPQRLDLVALVQESVTAFRPLAEHEGISLLQNLPDQPTAVCGDSEQLMRVIGNLLSNALKFSPAGGQVKVSLRGTDPDTVELRVDDSGPGVAEAWRSRIFDRFSQMGSEATRRREGAGLGLALCREVAELHGGRLYATDGRLGGAGFVFELPSPARSPLSVATENLAHSVTSTHAEPPEATNAPPGTHPPALPAAAGASGTGAQTLTAPEHADTRPLVLLAEDNPDLRAYLAGVLAEHYRVVAAADGQIALEQARSEPPDLVVTDLMMPNLDGLGLAAAMRKEVALAGVPIVFLTARASDSDRAAGLAGGADYYLTKPFDSRVLLAQLGAALRACHRLREHYASQSGSAVAAKPARSTFVAHLERAFAAHAHDPEFGVPALAVAMHMSESALRRHCRDECNASPGELLRRFRLERARALLAEGAGTVSEVAYAVGYSSLSAFSRAYRDQFDHAPTQA